MIKNNYLNKIFFDKKLSLYRDKKMKFDIKKYLRFFFER